jgi:hypothetical protein
VDEKTFMALRMHADQAVGTVHARLGRRHAMREELCAHLCSTFQEEREEGANEQAALEAAVRRFGNLAELRGQLEASVPWWERSMVALFLRKEQAMTRTLGIGGILGVLVGMAVVMPAMAKLEQVGMADQMLALLAGTIATTISVMAVGFGLWRWRMRAA